MKLSEKIFEINTKKLSVGDSIVIGKPCKIEVINIDGKRITLKIIQQESKNL